MPKASELEPQPRCTVLCRNVDTNKIERCARWADHEPPEDHNSYREVLHEMIAALIKAEGIDERIHGNVVGPATLIYAKRARVWYQHLVTSPSI